MLSKPDTQALTSEMISGKSGNTDERRFDLHSQMNFTEVQKTFACGEILMKF